MSTFCHGRFIAGVGVALGVSACCLAPTAASSPAEAVPPSADYIAEVVAADGSPMTMAIAVDGENVVAYATDGTSKQAYFFGVQRDGRMTLESGHGDTLTAALHDDAVTGNVAVVGAQPAVFTAAHVTAPAGMYTASDGPDRATWIVRPDASTVGMMDRTCAVSGHLDDAPGQFCRDRRPRPAPRMSVDTMSAAMGDRGTPMRKVTGATPM